LKFVKIIGAIIFCLIAPVEAFASCGGASWYGPGFHGKKTASGERFNQHAMTAAHRSFKFGSKLKVTNQKNGKFVIVRVNDRGPFHGKRIVDLSKAAAYSIGITGVGKICMHQIR